jgi:hypothetical protein
LRRPLEQWKVRAGRCHQRPQPVGHASAAAALLWLPSLMTLEPTMWPVMFRAVVTARGSAGMTLW